MALDPGPFSNANSAGRELGAVSGDFHIQSGDIPFGEGKGRYYEYERVIPQHVSALGSTVAEGNAEDFDVHYRTNILSPYLPTKDVLPLIVQR